jgi:hypothetical protein
MTGGERITASQAGRICGYTAKTMRKLAENGNVPGAAFLVNQWRFDESRLREWIRRQEAQCQTKISSSATACGTPEKKFEDGTSDEAYARLLGLRPKNASPRF